MPLPEHGTPVTDANRLPNLRAARRLPAGSVLTDELLAAIPLIACGDEVQLTVQRGGVRLTTSARAHADGFLHDRIRVVNPDSGRFVTAEVIGPGAVLVR